MHQEFKVGQVVFVKTPPTKNREESMRIGNNNHYIKQWAPVEILSVRIKTYQGGEKETKSLYYIVKPLKKDDFSWDWNIGATSTGVTCRNDGKIFTGIQFLRPEDLVGQNPRISVSKKDSLPLF